MKLYFTILVLTVLHIPVHTQILNKKVISRMADSSVVTIYVYDFNNKRKSIGSGVVIQQNGFILTNAHLFEGWKRAEVYNSFWHKSYEVPIKPLFYEDSENDFVIFKIDTINLKALKFGDSDPLVKGEDLYCIGSPGGSINTFSAGVLSNLIELPYGKNNETKKYLQLQNLLTGGSSGGALLNEFGELIGITTGSRKDDYFSVAIPINRIVEQFKSIGINLNIDKTAISTINMSTLSSRGKYANVSLLDPKIPGEGLGTVSTWTNCIGCIIDVFIDKEFMGKVETYFRQVPNCNNPKTLISTLTPGKHLIEAKDNVHGVNWKFEVNLGRNECKSQLLQLN